MKLVTLLFITLGCLGPILVAGTAHAQEWERVYEADNLHIERRANEGSALNEIRGVTRVQASLNALMALLKDADFNEHWVYRSGGARILQEAGHARAYVYGIVDAPWPMDDRDTVVRFDYRQDPETKEITIDITNVPDFIAVKADFIRVPEIGGYWRLTPEKDGWVEVTYQVYGDPGGWIPAWLANQAAEYSVRMTLQNMISVVNRYAGVKSEFIEEAAPGAG